MTRFLMMAVVAAGLLAGCTQPTQSTGTSGSTPSLYRINAANTGRIQLRVLESVNTLRRGAGQAPVTLDAQLNAAAATHSRDMAIQNRPWHFGSDGSSPIERVQRVGYTGRFVGEVISETYETELQTLAAWMDQEDTRRTILAPDARQMGFAWFQQQNGKIWWTLVMGDPSSTARIPDQNPAASRLVPGARVNQTPDSVEETPGIVTIRTTIPGRIY